MGTELLKRSEFAALAKVTPGAITQACDNGLRPALVGNRIDAAHPCARQYVEDRGAIDPDTGIDRRYYEVVEYCQRYGITSAQTVRDAFNIGTARATAILDLARASGDVPLDSSQRAAPHAPATASPSYAVASVPVFVGRDGAGAALPLPESESIEIPEDIQHVADMTLRDLIARYGSNTRFGDWLKALKDLEVIEGQRIKNAVSEGRLVSRELVRDGVISHIDATFRQMLTDGAKTIAQRVIALHDSGAEPGECEELVRDQIQSFIKPMKKKITAALPGV